MEKVVTATDADGDILLAKILHTLVDRAIGGDVRAAAEVLDRLFGKAKMSMDHTSGGQTFAPIIQVMTQREAELLEAIAEDARRDAERQEA